MTAPDLAAVIRPAAAPMKIARGYVTAVPDAAHVTVNVGGLSLTVALLNGPVPVVGATALIVQQGRESWCLGTLASLAAPGPPTLPTPPPPPPTSGTRTFPALTAGSWRAGTWRTDRTDVLQGDPDGSGINQGAWYLGTAPAGTLGGRNLTAAYVWLDRRQGGSTAPQQVTLYLHADATRGFAPPASVDALVGPTLAVGDQGWYPIPLRWAQQIIAGTAAGLGVYVPTAAPFVALASLATDGNSGALQLSWSG